MQKKERAAGRQLLLFGPEEIDYCGEAVSVSAEDLEWLLREREGRNIKVIHYEDKQREKFRARRIFNEKVGGIGQLKLNF